MKCVEGKMCKEIVMDKSPFLQKEIKKKKWKRREVLKNIGTSVLKCKDKL